jgi:hypothetical protein
VEAHVELVAGAEAHLELRPEVGGRLQILTVTPEGRTGVGAVCWLEPVLGEHLDDEGRAGRHRQTRELGAASRGGQDNRAQDRLGATQVRHGGAQAPEGYPKASGRTLSQSSAVLR